VRPTHYDPAATKLRFLFSANWLAQAVHAAAELGIADLLAAGPRTADDLAAATGTHAPSLYRLLRALAGYGVFAEDDAGRFGLTPMAEYLRSDVPGSQRAAARCIPTTHSPAYQEIVHSVRTGEPAFARVFGKPLFDWLAGRPEQAPLFDATMTGVHGDESRAMLDAYDLADRERLVDVGGGNGSTLRAALERYPGLTGVLFDRPHVVERARTALAGTPVAGRVEFAAGDFFAAVPAGGDVYLLRHILHDWYDPECVKILTNIRRAMRPDGRLLVVESVIPPGNGEFFGKLLDLTMLVVVGGMERTEDEYRRLFESVGFRLARVVPTAVEVSVLEAVPV
jgi:SAM-dependent methyltransferase